MPSTPTIPVCAAIIVAAGCSRRMGLDKLLWPLAGIAVLQRSIEAFSSSPSIHSIIVVCPEARWKMLAQTKFTKPVTRVDGGETRQDSVVCGLKALDPECNLVAVHDGARPLIHMDDIERCVAAASSHKAASLGRRVTETMKRSDVDDFCENSVRRENLWSMETPQAFEISLLRCAYEEVKRKKLTSTDEVSAVQVLRSKIKLVESRHPNLKITTPGDLALAAALWEISNS